MDYGLLVQLGLDIFLEFWGLVFGVGFLVFASRVGDLLPIVSIENIKIISLIIKEGFGCQM
jgi:hypothetical protein